MNPEYLFFAQFIIEEKNGCRQHYHRFEETPWETNNSVRIQIKRTVCEKLDIQRPSISLHKKHSRQSSILAEVYVWSDCNGTTTWNSNLVYDALVC